MSYPDELVTFIIACYNEENYIQECVDSCLSQTYRNIEVCITDDGSTDNTWGLLNQSYSNSENVRLHRFEVNKGKIEAFNDAFHRARGHYVALIGADDVCFQKRIENSIFHMEYCDLVFGNIIKFNSDGVIQDDIMKNLHGLNGNQDISFDSLLYNPIVYGPTIFAKKEILNEIFPLDNDLSHEDWWIPLYAAYKGKVKYIDNFLIRYRVHPKQTTNYFNKKLFKYSSWKKLNIRELGYVDKVTKSFDLSSEEKRYFESWLSYLSIFQSKLTDRLAHFNKALYYVRTKNLNFLNPFILTLSPRLFFYISALKRGFLLLIKPSFIKFLAILINHQVWL